MSQKKIIVLDDELSIVRFLEKVLSKNGYKVYPFTDPAKALEKIKENSCELLITDIKMAGMNGMELIRKIKELNLMYPMEIVVITANATVDTAIECMRAGVIDYLEKPFEIKEVLAVVEKALATQEIKSRLVSMEVMDKLKDEFISTITHELKTPLMAIGGAAELLGMIASDDLTDSFKSSSSNKVIPEDEVKKFSDIVLRQVDKMKGLVEELLESARLSAGQVVVNKTPVNLDTLIKEAISDTQPIASSKNIKINYRSTDNVIVNCDYEQIKKVLNNLLANAIKYTQPGGQIDVTISKDSSDNNSVSVAVADNGIGLERDQLDKIFEKFYRVDPTSIGEATIKSGFGLGLSISKKIVELHNGSIWAESDGLGKGSRIIFTLPEVIKNGY